MKDNKKQAGLLKDILLSLMTAFVYTIMALTGIPWQNIVTKQLTVICVFMLIFFVTFFLLRLSK